jgi:hypothetical protein
MRDGFYAGGTFGSSFGAGLGLYADNHGNFYPQLYFGSPKLSLSGGYTPDVEGLLKGLSVSGTLGGGRVGYNWGTSGDPSAIGVGIGTPGVGATYGFGPFNIRDAFDFRPRTDEFGQPFPGDGTTAAPPADDSSGKQGAAPVNGNPFSKFFDSFRPTTDEFGNPFPEQQGAGGVLKYFGERPPAAEESAGLLPDGSAGAESDLDSGAALVVMPGIRRLASRVVRAA